MPKALGYNGAFGFTRVSNLGGSVTITTSLFFVDLDEKSPSLRIDGKGTFHGMDEMRMAFQDYTTGGGSFPSMSLDEFIAEAKGVLHV